MKKQLLFLISSVGLLITANTTFAQTNFQFEYDAAGNRIQRKIIVDAAARRTNVNTDKNKAAFSDNQSTSKKKTNAAGTDEAGNYFDVKVYPNPAQDKLNIEFDAKDNVTMHYYLSDSNGRVLVEKENVNQRDEVNMSGYQPGIYVLSITDNNNKQYEYKISKVK